MKVFTILNINQNSFQLILSTGVDYFLGRSIMNEKVIY